jgi:hypothetical protein
MPVFFAESSALRRLVLALSVAMIGASAVQAAPETPLGRGFPTSRELLQEFANLPLRFDLNTGQAEPTVKFVAHGPGYAVFLTDGEVVFSLRNPSGEIAQNKATRRRSRSPKAERYRASANFTPSTLRIRLLNAKQQQRIEGMDVQSGVANYFLGNDAARWRHSVPTFSRVKYHEVYRGIDLIYYGNQRELEYDFVIQPGSDPDIIALEFAGRQLSLDHDGSLILPLDGATVRWKKPVAYQDIDERRVQISAEYVIRGPSVVAFRLGDYDHTRPLIIDPVLAYATYLGGGALDTGEAIAVDPGGNVYITGQTLSMNFPTTNALRSTPAGMSDAYVTKLNSNGTAVIFSTYLGGSDVDIGFGIGLDSSNNVYITGTTTSPNFPTRNPFQPSLGGIGFPDAFVTKLGPAGTNILYSTYLGGPDDDLAYGLAVGSGGNVFVTGVTSSGSNFPKKNPFQNAGGGDDAFVARFSTTNTGSASLIYASWLGDADDEQGEAIAVDGSGNAFVVGEVFSLDYVTASFPVRNAFQPVYGQGGSDVFVTKIASNGAAPLIFSTYLGGRGEDSGYGVALDSSTNIYVTGETFSTNFPIVNAYQTVRGGSERGFYTSDVFVTKIHRTGSNLLYSTFLGGDLDDTGEAIAVGTDNLVYVTGETKSEEFPLAGRPLQSTYGGGAFDSFAAVLNPAASGTPSLLYSTFLGGADEDQGRAIAVDINGCFYLTGLTASTNRFPLTSGAYRQTYSGGFWDGFVAKFNPAPLLEIARMTNRTTLTWPTIPAGFNLQRNTNVASTNWVAVTNAPVVSNSLNRVTLTNNSAPEFYRLRRP